ncbi:MAG: site-specific integrase, partial [Treponema sp.]|nr:site-specific integrase [Treponema sp.]
MKTKRGKGEIMDAIARRITEAPAASSKEMARRIRLEAPTLKDLNNEQLEQVARLVIAQRLAAELDQAAKLDGIDWQEMKEAFLCETRSVHTRRAYAAALGKLEAWTSRLGKSPLELNAWAADQFIRELKAEGKAPATTRRDIAAVSAFYTWLERYHDVIKNPVRGTKIRPARENKKDIIIPTAADYITIITGLPP